MEEEESYMEQGRVLQLVVLIIGYGEMLDLLAKTKVHHRKGECL
jgi:hypothetical protein